jgi:hypothetical protein
LPGVGSQAFRYVKLKLASQDSEIWVAPHGAFSIFEFAGPDTRLDELSCNPIFLLSRHIAEDCALAILFAVFRHR